MNELRELLSYWHEGDTAADTLSRHCDATAARQQTAADDAAYAAWQTAVRQACADIGDAITAIKAAVASINTQGAK